MGAFLLYARFTSERRSCFARGCESQAGIDVAPEMFREPQHHHTSHTWVWGIVLDWQTVLLPAVTGIHVTTQKQGSGFRQ